MCGLPRAACLELDGAIHVAVVSYLNIPLMGLLPWGPPRSWHGDSKAWQEVFNPAETPRSIMKA